MLFPFQMRSRRVWLLIAIILSTLLPPLDAKRGGILGGSRSRGSSASRSGGGLFGGGSKPMRTSSGANAYHRNLGGVHQQRPHQQSQGHGWGGGTGGGWGGRQQGQHGMGSGGWGSRSQSPKFTSHGIGSRSRSNTFKNMIVGAAAGYLTYQAGKAIIRSMAGPMMWNNRPYYWGSSYYRPQRGHENICRMPIDPNDPQFGNVYQPDGVTRPHEIVWGCGYYEYCCGYECCRGGGVGAIGYSASIGWAFALVYIARAYLV
ncbi:hypothetical protein Y032_0105g3710 [Ancylostoma ceylanicum]|uniref:CX domain-containing protein n=3 Tax=Ancylostoma ceylanicum TaxID=53326 RepID=A0A016TGK1_9BILA|nr:hypothetical protein Y032_0105g3710 [Ancylostoma ceylanicum]